MAPERQLLLLSAFEKQLEKIEPSEESNELLFRIGTKYFLLGKKDQSARIYEEILKLSDNPLIRGKTYYQMAMTVLGESKKANQYFELSTAEYRKESFPIYQLIAENYGHVITNHIADRNADDAKRTIAEFFSDAQLVESSDPELALQIATFAASTVEPETINSWPHLIALLKRESEASRNLKILFQFYSLSMIKRQGEISLERLKKYESKLSGIFKGEELQDVSTSVEIGNELQLAQLTVALLLRDSDNDESTGYFKKCLSTSKKLIPMVEEEMGGGDPDEEINMKIQALLIRAIAQQFTGSSIATKPLNEYEDFNYRPQVSTHFPRRLVSLLVKARQEIELSGRVGDLESITPDKDPTPTLAREKNL